MEPDSLALLVKKVLDVSSSPDGNPSERSMVALFAAIEPSRLDRLLREMVSRALVELEPSVRPSALASIREVVEGTRPSQSVDEVDYEFPGGDWLLEAIQAVEASSRLWRSTVKSLSHALAAAGAAAEAVVENRDWQRDPVSWSTYRKRLALPTPMEPGHVGPERTELRARDRRDVWSKLLTSIDVT